MGGFGWGFPRTRTVIVPTPVPTRNGGGGGYHGGGSSDPPPRGSDGNGCLTVVLVLVVFLLLVGIGMALFGGGGSGGNITPSTVAREPLPPGSVNETGYYTDELGWIILEKELLPGMKEFYKQTGVQPYLYLAAEVNGSLSPTPQEMGEYAERLYEELFTDEAHLLLVFQEGPSGNYTAGYAVGSQAKTVMDDEAVGVLRDYLDRYYYDTDGLSDEEYFGKVFEETARRIMTVTKSPWPMVVGIFGVLLIGAGAYFWWQKAKEKKAQELAAAREILDTPLETFGDTEAERLAEKYKESAPGSSGADNQSNNKE